MKLDALHQQMRDLFIAELLAGIATGNIPEAMDRATDEVFQTCPGGECCDQCASIFCPHGEPLHFHHDGCPCCSSDDIELPVDRGARHIARVKRWRVLLKRNQQQ